MFLILLIRKTPVLRVGKVLHVMKVLERKSTCLSSEIIASDLPHPNPPLHKGRELVCLAPPPAKVKGTGLFGSFPCKGEGNWFVWLLPLQRGRELVCLAPPPAKVKGTGLFGSFPCKGEGNWFVWLLPLRRGRLGGGNDSGSKLLKYVLFVTEKKKEWEGE